jgi:hypothetical protein
MAVALPLSSGGLTTLADPIENTKAVLGGRTRQRVRPGDLVGSEDWSADGFTRLS